MIKTLFFALISISILPLALINVGCESTGKSMTRFDGSRTVTIRDDEVIIEQVTKGAAAQTWPKGAKDPGGTEIDHSGVSTNMPGVYDMSLSDVAFKTAIPYHAAAILCVLVAAFLAMRGRLIWAGILGATAIILGAMPTILGMVGMWIGVMVILGILTAVGVGIYMIFQYRKRGKKVAEKDLAPREKVAALRSTDPWYDKSGEWRKDLKVAEAESGSLPLTS